MTRVCAPKPIARPKTPAPAISGPMLTPKADKIIKIAMTRMTTSMNLRSSSSRVADARAAGAAFFFFIIGFRLRQFPPHPPLDGGVDQAPADITDSARPPGFYHGLDHRLPRSEEQYPRCPGSRKTATLPGPDAKRFAVDLSSGRGPGCPCLGRLRFRGFVCSRPGSLRYTIIFLSG